MKFRLGKNRRLTNSIEISRLFESKKTLKEFPVLMYYDIFEKGRGGIQIAFGVNRSKVKGAVQRNRVKRILKEAYRIEQYTLDIDSFPGDKTLALMLIHTSEKLPELNDSKEKIKILLKRLNKILKAKD